MPIQPSWERQFCGLWPNLIRLVINIDPRNGFWVTFFQTNDRMSQSSSKQLSVRLALGGDHAGFPLKQAVAEYFGDRVTSVIDCGTNSKDSCDYPDFAIAVARELIQGNADKGLMICGSGVGVSVAANKIPGIRASICHDTYSAHQGVEHDDMNVLCIGGRIIGSELAFEIIEAFLNAKYTPSERHQRRLDKVLDIEKRGLDALK